MSTTNVENVIEIRHENKHVRLCRPASLDVLKDVLRKHFDLVCPLEAMVLHNPATLDEYGDIDTIPLRDPYNKDSATALRVMMRHTQGASVQC